MKKNLKTYILLAVVAFIWGTIGYQIISSGSTEPAPEMVAVAGNFKPKTTKEKDTFSITADYRDPFLGTMPKKKVIKKAKPKAPAPPEINIEFTGFVTDKDKNQNIFFVTIDGQQHLMSPKDEIQEVKLIQGSPSSIKVRYHNKTKTIPLKE